MTRVNPLPCVNPLEAARADKGAHARAKIEFMELEKDNYTRSKYNTYTHTHSLMYKDSWPI